MEILCLNSIADLLSLCIPDIIGIFLERTQGAETMQQKYAEVVQVSYYSNQAISTFEKEKAFLLPTKYEELLHRKMQQFCQIYKNEELKQDQGMKWDLMLYNASPQSIHLCHKDQQVLLCRRNE